MIGRKVSREPCPTPPDVGMYVGMWQDGLDLMREDIRRQLIALHQRQQ